MDAAKIAAATAESLPQQPNLKQKKQKGKDKSRKPPKQSTVSLFIPAAADAFKSDNTSTAIYISESAAINTTDAASEERKKEEIKFVESKETAAAAEPSDVRNVVSSTLINTATTATETTTNEDLGIDQREFEEKSSHSMTSLVYSTSGMVDNKSVHMLEDEESSKVAIDMSADLNELGIFDDDESTSKGDLGKDGREEYEKDNGSRPSSGWSGFAEASLEDATGADEAIMEIGEGTRESLSMPDDHVPENFASKVPDEQQPFSSKGEMDGKNHNEGRAQEVLDEQVNYLQEMSLPVDANSANIASKEEKFETEAPAAHPIGSSEEMAANKTVYENEAFEPIAAPSSVVSSSDSDLLHQAQKPPPLPPIESTQSQVPFDAAQQAAIVKFPSRSSLTKSGGPSRSYSRPLSSLTLSRSMSVKVTTADILDQEQMIISPKGELPALVNTSSTPSSRPISARVNPLSRKIF